MKLIGIYGSGGFGREVMPLAREQFSSEQDDCEFVFLDDVPGPALINGHRVLNWPAFVAHSAENKTVCLAVGDSGIRERLAARCVNAEIGLLSVRASSVTIMDDVTVGEGAVLSPFVTLTSNIRIGRCFHANLYSYVAHDCVIGDYVTFAPKVCCNGNVVIEDHAYIGTGAILRQGTRERPIVIGRGAVVGMGAVVTKSVQAGETVIGNPARPMSRGG